MNKKVTSILSYCTIIGWLVGFFGGDRENAKFDLNQGLIIAILTGAASVTSAVISFIPVALIRIPVLIACYLLSAATVVLSVFGIINSAKGIERELPLVSQFKIIK